MWTGWVVGDGSICCGARTGLDPCWGKVWPGYGGCCVALIAPAGGSQSLGITRTGYWELPRRGDRHSIASPARAGSSLVAKNRPAQPAAKVPRPAKSRRHRALPAAPPIRQRSSRIYNFQSRSLCREGGLPLGGHGAPDLADCARSSRGAGSGAPMAFLPRVHSVRWWVALHAGRSVTVGCCNAVVLGIGTRAFWMHGAWGISETMQIWCRQALGVVTRHRWPWMS